MSISRIKIKNKIDIANILNLYQKKMKLKKNNFNKMRNSIFRYLYK